LPIRKAIPGQPISAKWLNDAVERTQQNKPARSNRTDYTSGEGGTGYREADYNPLLILKVTGTITGGYSFVEQTDPNADGTYTNADSGLTSTGTGLVLVPPSSLSLATDDLVVARRNPLNQERYEVISLLKSGSSLVYDSTALLSVYNLTASSGTFEDIITLPSSLGAGVYLFEYTIYGELNVNSVGNWLKARILLATSVAQADSVFCFQQVASTLVRGSMTAHTIYNGTPGTVKLQAARVFAGAVSTSLINNASSAYVNTRLSYLKLG
jgi:hypothetical protein